MTPDHLDAAVLRALRERGHVVTYVIRNRLSMQKVINTTTARVLRACKRLEAAGKIRRCVMICWEAVNA